MSAPNRNAPYTFSLCMFTINLTACCAFDTGLDCGLQANIQTRAEYAQFLRDHPLYDPHRNLPYTFDPETGGWVIR